MAVVDLKKNQNHAGNLNSMKFFYLVVTFRVSWYVGFSTVI